MKVVFLDVDGVLNCRNRWEHLDSVQGDIHSGHKIDPLAVARLNQIAKGCSVVVSSTWRFIYTPEELRGHLLRFGLDPSIPLIDRTAREGGSTPQRGREIQTWLANHPEVTAYVVLDDDNDMDGVRKRFVKTTWADGLQDGHVKLALLALSKPRNAA